MADNSYMEQTILKQKMSASTQSPNIFLQRLLHADHLLSHLRLNDLRLNRMSRLFIIGLVFPPFFFYIDFLIVVTLILLHTYSLQHSAVSDM